ncbi:hypothetical protein ACA910_016774 [Epithemia clementina (nom. ined.)]
MKLALLSITPILTALFVSFVSSDECLEVAVQDNFDLNAYMSAPWYVQEQADGEYLPVEKFFCVRSKLKKIGGWFERSIMGYTIVVHNEAQDKKGNHYNGELCAHQTNKDEEPAKLAVAPCLVPTWSAGAYWVVAYREGYNGYALVSGGQPSEETGNGCRTGTGKNQVGLLVLTRARSRNEEVVSKVREIAAHKGFDVTVLKKVEQENCNYYFGS